MKPAYCQISGFRIKRVEEGNAIGFRSNILARHPSVAFAVAGTRTSPEGSTHLVAHFLLADKSAVSGEHDLKVYLRGALPITWFPRFLCNSRLCQFSANGKVDLSRLPGPSSAAQSVVRTQSVTNEVEIRLSRIVQDLLGRRSISEHDTLSYQEGIRSLGCSS